MINFKQIIKNSQIKNGAWLYVLQIFNTAIPLITLPYITRVLGASEYGRFSIAFNLICYFQVIVEFGFGMSGVRKISINQNKENLNKAFTTIFLAKMLLCMACFLFMLLYIGISENGKTELFCLLYLFIIPIGTVLQQTWVFQGLQKMKYITITSVFARLLSLIFIFSFVKKPSDLYLYCIGYSLTDVFLGVIGIYFVLSRFGIRFCRITVNEIMEEFKAGWYVFTTTFSARILAVFGVTVMGIMLSAYEVGVYSAIQKIPSVAQMAFAPVGQVLYPMASIWMTSSYVTGRKKVKKIQVVILAIMTLGCFVIGANAKIIIALVFGKEYSSMFYIIYPLLVWLLLGINNNFWGIQTLLAGGYSKEYSQCFQVSVICTIFFNIIFIKYWGIMGAALSPMLSEAVLSALLYMKIRKLDFINGLAK